MWLLPSLSFQKVLHFFKEDAFFVYACYALNRVVQTPSLAPVAVWSTLLLSGCSPAGESATPKDSYLNVKCAAVRSSRRELS